MSRLDERRYINIPFDSASRYLAAYVRDVETCCSGTIRLAFNVTLERLGFDRNVKVAKAVSVQFKSAVEGEGDPNAWAIAWQPENGGPFPHFTGRIGIESGEKADVCYLLLDGEYDPPLGLLGDAFDSAIGKHIARLSARNLLDEIAIAMETSHLAAAVGHPER